MKQGNDEFLTNLRSEMMRRDMSQRVLSKLVSKKESEISRWLSGKVSISKANRMKIESALGVPLSPCSTFRRRDQNLRIGIIGSGNVAGRFVRETAFVEEVAVSAVFNPDYGQALSFCEQNAIAVCCKSLDDLWDNSDAVYIASPICTHFSYCRLALEHNHHVLCEMPFTDTRREADALYRIAAKNDLVLLPALKTAYCESFLQMVSIAKSGVIGKIVDVSATVTNLLPEDTVPAFSNERMMENLTYPILVLLKLFGPGPDKVHSFVREKDDKVLFVHSVADYGDCFGDFKIGVGVKSEGSLVISGTEGYIYVPAPWWKMDYFEVRFENPGENKKYYFPYEAAGLRYEIKAFYDSIKRSAQADFLPKTDLLAMIDLQNKMVSNRYYGK